jgi:hypothetical protein
MPRVVLCPKCQAKTELPDRPVDKTCCLQCKTVFAVGPAAPASTRESQQRAGNRETMSIPSLPPVPAELFDLTCPECGKILQLKEDAAGQKVWCPVCNSVFVAEMEEEPTLSVASWKEQLGNPLVIGSAGVCVLAVGILIGVMVVGKRATPEPDRIAGTVAVQPNPEKPANIQPDNPAVLIAQAPAAVPQAPAEPTPTPGAPGAPEPAPAIPQPAVPIPVKPEPRQPQCPYPECTDIVADLKTKLNDPRDLEILTWEKTVRDRRKVPKANLDSYGAVLYVLQIRARTQRGARVVTEGRYNYFPNGSWSFLTPWGYLDPGNHPARNVFVIGAMGPVKNRIRPPDEANQFE